MGGGSEYGAVSARRAMEIKIEMETKYAYREHGEYEVQTV